MRVLTILAVLLTCALACSSGGASYEDCDSEIEGVLEPFHLSGSAWKDEEGALQITLNPLVNAESGRPPGRSKPRISRCGPTGRNWRSPPWQTAENAVLSPMR